ncbi:ABC transporter ATP-binding protein [Chloroflexota bacterium]
MSDIAIRVENLSKLYRIGQYVGYKTLRESMLNTMLPLFRRFHSAKSTLEQKAGMSDTKYIWAVKDISFEIKRGEVVGIIGRNGAGKTTLLKLLSRITSPTEGLAEIHGRVGSLLEVGTGFHPELTGLENIYLNGAVLGMKKSEIDRKLSEIIEFAGVEKFIDTPLKRYSSGMQVRLAFSVAAHLDPEILLVDEVLAVGDAAFQKKCLGRMGQISQEGRTVLFVSHNMAAVQSLCQRVFLLESGMLARSGKPAAILQEYLSGFEENKALSLENRLDRKGDGKLRFTKVIFADDEGNEASYFKSGSDVKVILEYTSDSTEKFKDVLVTMAIDSPISGRICVLQTDYSGNDFSEVEPQGTFICEIPRLPLTAGIYPFTIAATIKGVMADWIIGAGVIRVEVGDYYETGKYPDVQDGRILMQHKWTHEISSSKHA